MASTSSQKVYGVDVYTNIEKMGKVIEEDTSFVLDTSKWEYDVFICFRGCDTRTKFVSHLYNLLANIKGFNVFKDDVKMPPGEYISHILKVIGKAMVAIIVISKNFTFSSFCLDEVVEIMKCNREKGQIVLPIFYELDPTHVEKHRGPIRKGFQFHKRGSEAAKIPGWRDALSAVAGIVGWESLKRFDGNEAELINGIIKFLDKLTSAASKTYPSSYPSDLVRLDFQMRWIRKLLDLRCKEVRMIGIWGFGGVGKTTIAQVIVTLYAHKFQSYCFLKDVRENYEKHGDTYLQKELLKQTLGGFKEDIRYRADGCKIIRRRLNCKKVLIVLDDVDDSEQLMFIAGSLDWFGQESRVIITTRDRQVLNEKQVDHIYIVPPLDIDQSLQLFYKYAFKDSLPQEDFRDLSISFVSYAQGLPLVLIVMGKLLSTRHSKHEWQRELDRLKKSSYPNIIKILKISYDRLKDKVTEDIFLDIAFSFNGELESKVENILSGYGWTPTNEIRTLKDRALVTSSGGVLHMHDMIREMAYDIVRSESKTQHERSRLSNLEDVSSMFCSEGISKVEVITLLDISKKNKKISLKSNAFQGLTNLRILKVCTPPDNQVFEAYGDGVDHLSQKLMYFHWDCFPFKYWPSIFVAENLVELRLRFSKLESLWSEETELGKLKVIDLSHGKCLKVFPNLSKAMNVEEIYFNRCESLIQFSSGLQHLKEVREIHFDGCKKLKELPTLPSNLLLLELSGTSVTAISLTSIKSLTELWDLSISGDYKEVGESASSPEPHREAAAAALEVSVESICGLESLRHLNLENIAITNLPESFGNLKFLEHLTLIGLLVTKLPHSIGELKNLLTLHLDRVPLEELPESIGKLKSLCSLHLERVQLTGLTESIGKMKSLLTLHLKRVPLTKLPESMGEKLSNLHLKSVPLTELPESIGEWKSLSSLHLEKVPLTELPESIEHLHQLVFLVISWCTKLARLPSNLHKLPKLARICIKHCKTLPSLPQLPESLTDLGADFCESLGTLEGDGWDRLQILDSISFSDCKKLDHVKYREILEHRIKVKIQYKVNAIDFQSEENSFDKGIQCVCPGEEIPSWFDHKTDGSSIAIELPSHPFWVPAFCVVYAVDPYQESGNYKRPAEIRIAVEGDDRISTPYPFPIQSEGVDNNVVLWLSHDPKYFGRMEHDSSSVQLNFSPEFCSFSGEDAKHVKVRKCGVHIFHSKELKFRAGF